MIRCRPLSCRLLLGALLGLGLSALGAIPGPSPAQEPSRAQQIADLERKIQELTRQLNELRQAPAQPSRTEEGLPASWVQALHWRSIGPASMGGRIVALAVCEADPSTYWVATASGGLLKTVNNGVTFEHQFDHQNTVSIGDVCVAPSDPNVVWVGTGEHNPRNSVSYGDGVYKSIDGGKTWEHMGLQKTFQIGRIAIHSKDPNIVYVGALGRLYGPNEERGLYKTTDGGKTWNKVLAINDRTGVIEVRMHPTDPDTLLVATWERRRDEFDSHRGEPPPADGYDAYDPAIKWGPGSAIYKTTDGGKTFRKLTKGLPTVALGRVGLDYYRKDPNVVFALIDTEKIGMGPSPSPVFLGIQGEDAPGGGARLVQVSPASPAARAGLRVGDVIKSVDKKEVKDYRQLVEVLRSHKAGDKLLLALLRDGTTIDVTATLANRPDVAPPDRRPGPGGIGFRGEDVPGGGGVRVTRITPGSLAERAGLQAGDVIVTLGNRKVTDFRQLLGQLRFRNPGDKVALRVLRGKESKELALVVGGRPGRPVQVSRTRPYGFWYGGQRENVQDQQGPEGFQYGGVYKSTDGGESWTRVNSLNPRPMYFSQIRVDPSDSRYVYVLGILLYRSTDAGKTFKPDGNNGVHPDQHALWINPRDGRHMIVGCDGGFYATYDRMAHWDFLNHVAIGQFYHVALDTRRPYRVYGGLQDNGCWGGPSHTLDGQGPINADWILVSGGDGFVCRVDPADPDLVYFESQDGNMGRRNLRTGERHFIRPANPRGGPPYRFNWNTPFLLSAHNTHIFYCGGNYVFRSVEQGDNLRPISPEITRTKRGSATSLAESPRNPDVIWAGTDDGYLWVTRDGGARWVNITANVWKGEGQAAAVAGTTPGGARSGPHFPWVASIEASRFVEGRAYVAFDAHRSNDDDPYLFVTEDFGQTWKPIRSNLPTGSTRVLREDPVNPDLLLCGTEFGAWASVDRGQVWTRINNNLPTVAVHEFGFATTAPEVVAATHGRSLWVLDLTPLRQTNRETLKAAAQLFQPAAAVRWRNEPQRATPYGAGSRHFVGTNPPSGAQIHYSLGQKAGSVRLRVLDYTGRVVRELPARTEPGLHQLSWDLRGARPGSGGGPGRGQRGGLNVFIPSPGAGVLTAVTQQFLAAAPQGRRGGRPAGPPSIPMPPGMYRVVLTVDGKELAQGLRVEADPLLGPSTIITEEESPDEDELSEEMRPKGIDD